MTDIKELCLRSFDAVVKTVQPQACIKDFIPARPAGRLIVIGAGKASAAMAAAFEDSYEDGPIEGLVITRYGHNVPTKHIRIIEAAHPVPDEKGQEAVAEMLRLLETVNEDDLVVCLISGGGSSLLSRPVKGIDFKDLQKVQRALLGCGADITEVNTVRKHLNIALGGGLAKAAAPAKMITLAISDVVGDDSQVIASGASVADSTSLEDARDILERYRIDIPASVHNALSDPRNETAKPDDPVFARNEYHLIATPAMALQAAKSFWEAQGFAAQIWNAEVEGDTEAAAHAHIDYIRTREDVTLPCAVITGGETTMTLVPDGGQGGPNSHFMLQSAILLNGHPRIYGMACDTDGIDGNGDHAGAIIIPDTLKRAKAVDLKAEEFSARQDSYHFFDTIGDLVKTGPSHTNVNDYRVFVIMPPQDNQ